MKKQKREVVICPQCGISTFNSVGKCKCGYKFPYNELQDEIVIDICSNCREIREYKNGDHIGGTYTICPICNNGKLTTLGSAKEWTKLSNYEKETYIQMIKKESIKPIQNQNTPKCPICQSTNLSKISTLKKATKIGLFGLFGAGDVGKTWKCNNCGSKF